jgi:hypothetical protein
METTINNGRTVYKDDRTEDQHKTHTVLITATDKCMSGWGMAAGGASKCAWAVERKNWEKMLKWVESRSDMKYVNVDFSGKWKPRNAKHVHIYVANDNHPAFN